MIGLFVVVAAVALLQPSIPTTQVVVEGDVRMTVQWSRPTIAVAEPIEVTIRVEAPTGSDVTLPTVEPVGSGLTIVDQRATELGGLTRSADRASWTWRASWMAFRPGEFEIPPLSVGLRDPDLPPDGPSDAPAQETVLTSEPITITVTSVLSDQEDPTRFRDLKQPAAIEPTPAGRSYGAAIAVSASLIALAWLARFGWRRYWGPTEDRMWAWSELARLEAISDGASPHLYDQLAAIVRQVIGDQVGGGLQADTTDQMIESLRQANWPESTIVRVNRLLRLADQEKFAGRIDPRNEPAESGFQLARSILTDCDSLRSNDQGGRR